MGFNWGGKKWRPADVPKKQPKINQSIEELLKPLSEKTWKGNVWGSQIMNVEKETAPDVSPTPTPTVTPTQSVTPSVTPTQSVTPSITPSVTPSISVTPTPTVTPTPSSTPPAPLSFQQTSTVNSPSLTSSANCVSRTAAENGVLQRTSTVGGTASSEEITIVLGGSRQRYMFQNKLIIPSGTTWNAGTWTYRIDVRGSGVGIKLEGVDICRVNSSGVSQATIASVSGLFQTVGGTRNVMSGTLSGSSQTPSAGDFVVITYTFENATGDNLPVTFWPTQITNSPFI